MSLHSRLRAILVLGVLLLLGSLGAGAAQSAFVKGQNTAVLPSSISNSRAQVGPEVTTWAETFGASANDYGHWVAPTGDGGSVVAGQTYSFGAGGSDAWVLKLNGDGTVAWQNSYGGTGYDTFNWIAPANGGGYMVAGYSSSFGAGGFDAWVLKLNGDGTIAWQNTFGGSADDVANSVAFTTDGGYVVAGYSYSYGAGGADAWVLKLNSDGSLAWQETYGGSRDDFINSIELTADGGALAAGQTGSFGAGGGDAWVLKLNANGSLAWQKTYGGAGSDYAYSIAATSDGGAIAAGASLSYGAGQYDAWVLKLNSDGSLAWQKTLGGAANDLANSVELTADGGYIVAGSTGSFGAGGSESWVLKLDGDGSLAWQKTFGGSAYDTANRAAPANDGGYIVAGSTSSFGAGGSDAWVLKLDANGGLYGSCTPVGMSAATPATSAATPAPGGGFARPSRATPAGSGSTPASSGATPAAQCAPVTSTPTPTGTNTPTSTPSSANTPTSASTPTLTSTATATQTATNTATTTATTIPSAAETATVTVTSTPTATLVRPTPPSGLFFPALLFGAAP